uniref:Uncharacterized protein n=1 Tax=Arundo donax TaxID=35708 RepID=A0A0A9DGI6_ARUDO
MALENFVTSDNENNKKKVSSIWHDFFLFNLATLPDQFMVV